MIHDGLVGFYLKGHGTYQTTPQALDKAMWIYRDTSVNDLMWLLIEHSGYELDYSDIQTKIQLLVIWCDTHGFCDTDPQNVEYLAERNVFQYWRKPSETVIRGIQDWFGQIESDRYVERKTDERRERSTFVQFSEDDMKAVYRDTDGTFWYYCYESGHAGTKHGHWYESYKSSLEAVYAADHHKC